MLKLSKGLQRGTGRPLGRRISPVDRVLSNEERRRVIMWLIERKTPQEVADLVNLHFKKDITRQAIWKYHHSRKWKPLIERVQRAIANNLAKIPIANKSYRLVALQKALNEAMTWTLKGETKMGAPIYELKIGAAIKAIEAAKEEIEPSKGPRPVASTINIHYDYRNGKRARPAPGSLRPEARSRQSA